MKRFAKSLSLLALILILFLLLGSGCAALPGAPEEEAPAEEQAPEQEEEETNGGEENSATEPVQTSKQVVTSGSGFKHEVQMTVEGVVETGQDEGWWIVD